MQPNQLFSATEAAEAEADADRRVDRVTRRFLTRRSAGSRVAYGDLVARCSAFEVADEPVAFAEYLDELEQGLVRHAPRVASPLYMGHMTSALPYFVRPLARLVTALNQNPVKVETARSLSPYERQTLAMLHRLVYDFAPGFYAGHVQNPASTLGMVGSGGTLANVTALWCARNAALGPAPGFAGVEAEGMAAALRFHGCADAVVIGSSMMHYSFDKAVDLLGLGTRALLRVPAGPDGRVDPDALRETVAECRRRGRRVLAVVGIAGTTDAGSIDPLREIGCVAREAGAHFHVDGAWGGVLAFSPRHRHLLDGIETADTVTVDGHKQMYTPMGTGVLLFRDPALARVVERRARYILRRGSVDLGRRALEGSRPAAVLYLHAALRLIGREGFAQLVEDGMRKAAYMAAQVRARRDFRVLVEPQTNILLYRMEPAWAAGRPGAPGADLRAAHRLNRLNARVQKVQRREARSFVSRTSLPATSADAPPTAALRAVLANPLTLPAHIDAVLDEQERIAARLRARRAPQPAPDRCGGGGLA